MDAIEQDYAAIASSLESEKPDTAKVKKKLDNIDEMLASAEEHVPIGKADDLPNQNIQMEEIAPTTKKDTLPSYLSRNATILNSLETTPQDPTETTETKFTKDIEELADSLDDTPLSIYEHVKNTIQFEPYFGSRKGATGTLQQQSGNAVDQASLLIALLRYKEIPARYVSGTVEIPIDQVTDWIRVKDPEQAVKTIASLGIPVRAIIKEGKIFKVQMEHTWVEAHIPYEDYRGTGKRQGEQVWVPLDPSFKQSTYTEGIDIEKVSGLDKEEVLGIIQNSGIETDEFGSITDLDITSLQEKIEEAKETTEVYLKQKGLENASYEDVFGKWTIKPESVDLLPVKLPYKLINEFGEFHELPKTMQESIGFSIRGATAHGFNFSGGNDFTYEATAAELYGKRITLSWQPATKADENIIAEYGGIYQVPAYMVKVRPVLKVDGKTVEQGKPVGLGYNQEFIMDFHVPGRSADKVRNPVSAGSFYAVGLKHGKVATAEMEQIRQNLESVQAGLTEETLYTDEGMGEALNGIIKAYYGQLDSLNAVISDQNNVSVNQMLNAGMTGSRANVAHSFTSPVSLSPGGMYIDIDRSIVSVVSKTGDDVAEKGYMMASGIYSSAMEHAIFEQAFGVPSVSAIKLLDEANSRGIPIHTITNKNIEALLPTLEASNTVKSDIRSAVNNNQVVVIPEEEIQYFDWQGAGYVVMDLETGAAGYMISGGLAGGSMAVNTIATVDIVTSIIALTAAVVMLPAAPLLGTVLILSISYSLVVLMKNLYFYHVMGDEKAGNEIVADGLLSIAMGPIGKGLKAFPAFSKLLDDTAFNAVRASSSNPKVVDDLAKSMSPDFVANVAKHSGTKSLPEAGKLAEELLNKGIKKELIESIGSYSGVKGLREVNELAIKGTGTVWDSIKITQPLYRNTKLPKSFEISVAKGDFWVHPNGTKHMEEYLLKNGTSTTSSLTSQQILTSFKGSVEEAVKKGIVYDDKIFVGNWELIFGKPREDGLLPIIYHAVYRPQGH